MLKNAVFFVRGERVNVIFLRYSDLGGRKSTVLIGLYVEGWRGAAKTLRSRIVVLLMGVIFG
jgi:hypothetical protein